jgi:hypothetical protein
LLFKAEMHNLQTPAPLKIATLHMHNGRMQYEVKFINSEDQKWNIAEARTNHPHNWLIIIIIIVHDFAPQTFNTKHSPAYNKPQRVRKNR